MMEDQREDRMGELHLYDTMTRSVMPVRAKDGKQFRFYCCGPTVYGAAHIGNFRTFLLQDVMRRVIELSGVKTKHVRNITDVDDKTIRDSQKEGKSLREFTKFWYEKLQVDSEKLNCLKPHHEPGAVDHIPEQIALIEDLVTKGHAYATEDGSVYYNVSSWEDYGGLSRLKGREISTGAGGRSDSDEYESKESLVDFALWKGRKPEDGDNFWESPWGQGRPGWHTECSAMSVKYLGKTFDLHSGGVDLIFPHHENEIAQSEACHGARFADHWFHIEHLMVDRGKMSKSLGNMYTVDDIEKMGHTANELRYVLISGYYRQQLNFTLDSLVAARQALSKLARFAQVIQAVGQASVQSSYKAVVKKRVASEDWQFLSGSWEALLDDLNTPKCLGQIFSVLKSVEKQMADKSISGEQLVQLARELSHILAALGVTLPEPEPVDVPDSIRDIAEARWTFRQDKNWEESDRIRDQLKSLGWHVMDGRDGYQMVPLPGTDH